MIILAIIIIWNVYDHSEDLDEPFSEDRLVANLTTENSSETRSDQVVLAPGAITDGSNHETENDGQSAIQDDETGGEADFTTNSSQPTIRYVSGSGGTDGGSGTTQTTTDTGPEPEPADESGVFFGSEDSSVYSDPEYLRFSSITSGNFTNVTFEMEAEQCKGSFEDMVYEDMGFEFSRDENLHSHTFENMEPGVYPIYIKCLDGASGYFDLAVIPEEYVRREGGAGHD